MKIEQLIVQYLYINKKVTIESMGSFFLAEEIDISDSEDLLPLPENAIWFTPNSKANVDEGLIKFIVEKTKKVKSLAISDLESFSITGKQFLNLGKPFQIKDLGSLVKNQNNEFEFTQAANILSNSENKNQPSKHKKDFKEKESKKIDFSTPALAKKKNIIPIITLIIISVIIIFMFIQFGSNLKKKETQTIITPTIGISKKDNDQIANPILKTDTVIKKVDTVNSNLPTEQKVDTVKKVAKNNTPLPIINYKVIVREYSGKEAADKGMIALSRFDFGKNLILYTYDSVLFKLAVPMKSTFKDTLRIKDSIKNLFGKNTSIDLN